MFAKLEVFFTRFGKLIEEYRVRFDGINKAKEQIMAYRASEDTIKGHLERIDSIKAEMNAGELELNSLHNRLLELKGSEEYQEILRIEKQKSEVEAEIVILNDGFEREFKPLARPLRKYLYARGLKKEDRELSNRYIDSASDALLSDNVLKMKVILSDLERCLEDRKIDERDSATHLIRIRSLIKEMPSIRARILELKTAAAERVKSLETPLYYEIKLTMSKIEKMEETQKSGRVKLQLLEEKLSEERPNWRSISEKIKATIMELYGIDVIIEDGFHGNP